MFTLKCFLVAFILIMILFAYESSRLQNPYKLIFLFGKKGSGKSTLLQKMLDQHKRKGWVTWSSDRGLKADYYFDFMDYGKYTFPPNSFVVCDEVGTFIHSRDYKTFPKAMRDIIRMQRKHKTKIVMCSQTFDVDKVVRDMCDEMYLCVKTGCFSIAKKISKEIVLTIASSDSPSSISENLHFELPTTWIVSYIPKYFKRFDTNYTAQRWPYFPRVNDRGEVEPVETESA